MKDLFESEHVRAAIYITDQGSYLFKHKTGRGDEAAVKCLREPDVRLAFSHHAEDSGWLVDGIVRAGKTIKGAWYIYFVPADAREIILKVGKKKEKLLIPTPSLILIGAKKKHYLFATTSPIFKPTANLFMAPFPNVFENGSICWGKNDAPAIDAGKADEVLKLFFNAPFNGDLTDGKSKQHKANVIDELRETVDMEAYPLKDLVACGSLETILSRLIGRNAGEEDE